MSGKQAVSIHDAFIACEKGKNSKLIFRIYWLIPIKLPETTGWGMVNLFHQKIWPWFSPNWVLILALCKCRMKLSTLSLLVLQNNCSLEFWEMNVKTQCLHYDTVENLPHVSFASSSVACILHCTSVHTLPKITYNLVKCI